MLNLNSTIDLDVHTFLHWWGRELSFLVPEKLKRWVSDTKSFVIVRVEPHQLTVSYLSAGNIELLTVLERNPSAITAYQDLLASDERLSKAKVILRLTGQDAIQRELTLPIAAKENLRQVVTYELDRYTPFKADQVYFAIKKLPKHLNEADQIKIMLVLTTRATFNALHKEVKAMGIVPLVADYEAVANDFDYDTDTYNLLPDWLSPKVAKTPQLIHSTLITLVFLLLSTVIVIPVWFEYQTVNTLTEKARKLEKETQEIKTLQLEIDALMEETQQIVNEKTNTPSVLTMLNTLSALMKDDTWLAYLQYADGQLQIQGESPAASTLIAILDDSEAFDNPEFVSPVMQDSISKQERFQITVEPAKKKTTDVQ